MNVTLFEKQVFVDTVKLRISTWDHPGVTGWVLNLTTTAIRKKEKHKHSGEKTERRPRENRAEVGGWGAPPEAKRDKLLPWSLQRKYGPADTLTLHFCPEELQENKFVFLFLFLSIYLFSPTAPSLPGWSPIRVLTKPNPKCLFF